MPCIDLHHAHGFEQYLTLQANASLTGVGWHERNHTNVHGPLPHLNEGITLSVRSRMVVITTSRGTEAVQLTSNMISSVLKSSRSIAILSTTASGVPKRLTSAVASGLAEPASVLPMLTLPA